MNAIVLAGGIPQPGDRLYLYSNGGSKALIDVAGKPMVQCVINALDESKFVDQIIVIGLSQKTGLTCSKPIHYISNQGRMLANIVAGSEKSLELRPNNDYLLVCSADIPALRGEMVDWLVKTAMQTEDDLYYGVCPKEVMEARYPASKRTYTKLKDMELCGADINITRISIIKQHMQTWEALIGNRKSPMRQAAIIGFDTLFQLATRQFTLESLVKRASQRIGIKGRAIVWEKAEACMDVDKPHQLELLREDLARQIRSEKAKARAKKK
ncbi:MAG: NTP transferase domain-containing protein [Chloroflexi bacterium]|nr:NTP transferase domain-containing protein [Chloroflexota bacterium]